MPLLDERGRLFGKVNLIDAAVAVFVLLLIPLAYGGYLLFRAPTPVVTSVEPRTIAAPLGATIDLKGENLRPFFRAYLGTTNVEYLFATPDRAVLKLPEMPAGDYEVILYDEAQEVARGGSVSIRTRAVVRDDPQASIVVVGVFNRLKAAEAAALREGLKVNIGTEPSAPSSDSLELLGVQPPRPAVVPLEAGSAAQVVEVAGRVQVVAVARVNGRAVGKDMFFGTQKIQPGVELSVPVEMPPPSAATSEGGAAPAAPAAPGKTALGFLVQKIHPGRPTLLEMRVRFITRPEILPVIQRDIASGKPRDAFQALLPQVLSVRVTSELDGGTRLEQREGRINILDAMIRVPGVRTADGWTYDGKPIKPGVELFLDTPNWQMSGIVLSMEPRSEQP